MAKKKEPMHTVFTVKLFPKLEYLQHHLVVTWLSLQWQLCPSVKSCLCSLLLFTFFYL